MSLCKTCYPQGRGNFWPQGDNLNKLGRGPLGQGSRSYGFRQEDFFMFSQNKLSLCKPYDPRGRDIFEPRVNLNKLGEGSLATYQISRL